MKLKFMLHGLHPNYPRGHNRSHAWLWTRYEMTEVFYEFNWLIFRADPVNESHKTAWCNYTLKQL